MEAVLPLQMPWIAPAVRVRVGVRACIRVWVGIRDIRGYAANIV